MKLNHTDGTGPGRRAVLGGAALAALAATGLAHGAAEAATGENLGSP